MAAAEGEEFQRSGTWRIYFQCKVPKNRRQVHLKLLLHCVIYFLCLFSSFKKFPDLFLRRFRANCCHGNTYFALLTDIKDRLLERRCRKKKRCWRSQRVWVQKQTEICTKEANGEMCVHVDTRAHYCTLTVGVHGHKSAICFQRRSHYSTSPDISAARRTSRLIFSCAPPLPATLWHLMTVLS